MAEAVPAEATVVVELPPLKPLAARLGLDSLLAEWIASGALAELAKRTNIPAEGLQQLWDGFQGAALFHLGDLEAPRSGKSICLVARFGPQTPVTKALAVAGFVQRKDGRWAHPKLEELTVQWVASGGLLVASTSPADLDRVTAVMRGSGPSFATTSLFRKGLAGTIWAVADLGRLAPSGEAAAAPSTAFLQLAVSESGTMDLRLELSGAPYPRLGTVLAPAPMELVAKLPGELIGAGGLSLARRPGKGLADLVAEIGRMRGSPQETMRGAEAALHAATGLSLADLDRAVGNELAFGVYLDPKTKTSLKGPAAVQGVAGIVELAIKDDHAARSLVDAIAKAFGRAKGLRATPGALTFELKPHVDLRLETRAGVLVGAVGGHTMVAQVMSLAARPKSMLGATPAFAKARQRLGPTMSAFAFVDAPRLPERLDLPSSPLQSLGGAREPIVWMVDMPANERGLELAWSSDVPAGAAVIGTVAAVAIYGVRRYLAASKVAEARSTLGALARAVAASYEREQPAPRGKGAGHLLCRSATPTPVAVPHGSKAALSTEPGHDFDSGDATTGWLCLRFAMSEPVYFQYDYRVGSGYKGPSRGGPNPGPKGFELSAEGDLDGDGKTSLFTRTGVVTADGKLALSPELFVADEFE